MFSQLESLKKNPTLQLGFTKTVWIICDLHLFDFFSLTYH